MAGPVGDAPELFDVDMDQLTRSGSLVAIDRLRRLKPRALAQALAQQHRRDRRERHPELLRDFRPGQAQLTQLADRRDAIRRSLVRDPLGR
jgi:hypothetical protein